VKVPVGDVTLKAQYTESTLRSIHNARLVDVNFPLIGRLRQHEFRGALSCAVSLRTTVCALATRRGGDEARTFSRKAEYSLGLAHNF
jgi:hypothetical protein